MLITPSRSIGSLTWTRLTLIVVKTTRVSSSSAGNEQKKKKKNDQEGIQIKFLYAWKRRTWQITTDRICTRAYYTLYLYADGFFSFVPVHPLVVLMMTINGSRVAVVAVASPSVVWWFQLRNNNNNIIIIFYYYKRPTGSEEVSSCDGINTCRAWSVNLTSDYSNFEGVPKIVKSIELWLRKITMIEQEYTCILCNSTVQLL